MTAQRRELYFLDVDAVDKYLTLLDIVVAADEGKNSGLARSRRADEGDRFSGFYLEGNVAEVLGK